MNNNNSFTENHDAQCGIDYCSTTYQVDGREVINNYRCNRKPFSATDLWRLRKMRRDFTTRATIQ
jgi:hypothetical protein